MQISAEERVLELSNVSKIYTQGEKNCLALQDVNLEVGKGEYVAIVGKSGSGKSTLLNLLGGIDKPTGGSIRINGKEITGMSEKQLSRFRGENIGFVFQFFQLMPTLTVLENVMMPMDFSGRIPSAQRKERAAALLRRVDMESHSHKFPSALSGGEQQRVAIARALANDPDIVFADEPTGNLDSRTAEDVFLLLESLAAEGKLIVMVTHNEELAGRSSRRINIHDGRIVSDLKRA